MVPASPDNRGSTVQWNPAITKCHGTEKMFVIEGLRYSEDPVITNYLVNSKKKSL